MPSSTSSSSIRAEYDARLIPMRRSGFDRAFLALTAVVAIVLAAIWNGVLPFVPKSFPTLNQAEDNRAKLVNYALSPQPEVVMSGSSMTYRLLPPYFTSLLVNNMSLAGGSPVTGAAVAATRPPKVMVVEINILDRPPREDLIAEGERVLRPPFGLPVLGETTTPVRAGVAWAYRLDAAQATQTALYRKRSDTILTQPPAAGVAASAEVLNVWKARTVIPETAKSAATLKRLLDEVEAGGGHGFYLQMPVDPNMADTAYAKSGRAALEAADPKFGQRFMSIQWSPELRWLDGVHLDERSAVIAARQVEQVIKERTGL